MSLTDTDALSEASPFDGTMVTLNESPPCSLFLPHAVRAVMVNVPTTSDFAPFISLPLIVVLSQTVGSSYDTFTYVMLLALATMSPLPSFAFPSPYPLTVVPAPSNLRYEEAVEIALRGHCVNIFALQAGIAPSITSIS